jgi:branched-chain amino acid transport system ATP-binding protein
MTQSAGITQERSPSAGVTLTVESLSVHYGGVCAVSSISFVVGQGQAVGIIGANGAGKTSTLKALMGLVPRSGGRIRLGTHDLNKIAPHERVRHGIGYVPEGRHVFAGLPVEKNLLLGAYARAWGKETDQALAEVYELFPVLGEMRGRLAGALSGGQQQMLAISRAIMAAPDLILLDEPSLGLSPKLTKEIFEIVVRINRERGTTILLVEQNANMALNASDHGYVLENGRIVMEDTCERLREKEDIKEFYLGVKDDGVRGERRWKKKKTWR